MTTPSETKRRSGSPASGSPTRTPAAACGRSSACRMRRCSARTTRARFWTPSSKRSGSRSGRRRRSSPTRTSMRSDPPEKLSDGRLGDRGDGGRQGGSLRETRRSRLGRHRAARRNGRADRPAVPGRLLLAVFALGRQDAGGPAPGQLGKVLQVRAHAGCSHSEADTDHMRQPGDIGGALFVIGCHPFDRLLLHFGMPRSVNARITKFPGVMGPPPARTPPARS